MRNKSLATIIGSVVFLGLYFAVIFRMNSYITQLAQNGAQIAAALSGAKVLVWLGRAMAGESAPALVWSLLATLAPFGLVSWLLGRSFTRIVTTKRGLPKVRYEEKALRTASADTALLHRELRRLSSSPTYLGQGVPARLPRRADVRQRGFLQRRVTHQRHLPTQTRSGQHAVHRFFPYGRLPGVDRRLRRHPALPDPRAQTHHHRPRQGRQRILHASVRQGAELPRHDAYPGLLIRRTGYERGRVSVDTRPRSR